MNQYRCKTCKNYEDDDEKFACNIREEWIPTDVWNWIKVVGCASHSDFQYGRDKVLDVIQEDINDFCKDMNRRLAELRQSKDGK
jgi:hypothetical protein